MLQCTSRICCSVYRVRDLANRLHWWCIALTNRRPRWPYERQSILSRSIVFCRRHGRGDHHRTFAHSLALTPRYLRRAQPPATRSRARATVAARIRQDACPTEVLLTAPLAGRRSARWPAMVRFVIWVPVGRCAPPGLRARPPPNPSHLRSDISKWQKQ